MARGDHLRVRRRGYWHHGIDCGDGTVIHFCGLVQEKRDACLRQTDMEFFIRGGIPEVVEYPDSDPPEVVLRRAQSLLGAQDYSLLRNNCEHFAHWCKTGVKRSNQVLRAARAGAGFMAAAVTLALALLVRPRKTPDTPGNRDVL